MYLARRDGIYYLRKRVPMDRIGVYGKREILRSVSVKDRAIDRARIDRTAPCTRNRAAAPVSQAASRP
ncbi:DUF6538 domain-containing protein [Cupriavidus sp. YAF13]|uniref:DUF6538 domain-containing protein n=1 Tax=Cupriavidus sp. YAF13 TaxID=3233075 RepID=UPI003F938721